MQARRGPSLALLAHIALCGTSNAYIWGPTLSDMLLGTVHPHSTPAHVACTMTQSKVLYATFDALPGQRGTVVRLISELAEQIRTQEEGNLKFKVFHAVNDPDHFHIEEEFARYVNTSRFRVPMCVLTTAVVPLQITARTHWMCTSPRLTGPSLTARWLPISRTARQPVFSLNLSCEQGSVMKHCLRASDVYTNKPSHNYCNADQRLGPTTEAMYCLSLS